MQRHDKILVAATIGLLAYTCLLSFLGPVVSSLVTNKTLGNTGSVNAVGVGVYWNSTGTNPVTSFNWGMLDPNSTKTITCYIKNEGNQVLTLSMTTANWNPSTATQYMTFSWNLGGQTINPGQIKQAIFTLQIFANATSGGITNFSFDVTIIGTS
jgi:hypothetical protein